MPSALSTSQWARTLDLMIQRWSPFAEWGSAVQWKGDRVSVYLWDRARVSAAVAAAGHDPSTCRFLPETFYRAAMTDGFRLATTIDGAEGQSWSGSFLTATRWWPRPPTNTEWATFARASAGSTADIGPTAPDPTAAPLLESPWTAGTDLAADAWEIIASPRYRPISIGLTAAIPVFLIFQWLSMSAAGAGLDSELARLMAASEPVRAQQDAVIENLDAIDRLMALDRLPSQFAVLAKTFELLRGHDVLMTEWTYDLGSLEFSIEGRENLEAIRFIEAFERDEMFATVSARTMPQPFTLRLKMDVAVPGTGT